MTVRGTIGYGSVGSPGTVGGGDAGTDYELGDWEFALDGKFVFNAEEGDYIVTAIDGLFSMDVRAADSPRTNQIGSTPGFDAIDTRTVRMDVFVRSTPARIYQAVNSWARSFDVRQYDRMLSYKMPSAPVQHVFGRPRSRRVDLELAGVGKARITQEFVCHDPRSYSDEHIYPVTLPDVRGGFTFPLEFPVDGGYDEIDPIILIVQGNVETPWKFNMIGPLKYPSLINLVTGQAITYYGDIADGDYVHVDIEKRMVLLNGEQNHRPFMGALPEWWKFEPGIQELRWTAYEYTGSHQSLEIIYRDATI